jgi:glucan phosphoethanolaminetransferase (alkaline phosphatase superfamily)
MVHRVGQEGGVSTSLVALLLLLGLLVGSEAVAWIVVRPDTALTRAITLALGLGLFAVVFVLALVAVSAKD